jgi:hypothetical protein
MRERVLESYGLPARGYEPYLTRSETQSRAKLILSSQGQMSKFELWEFFRAANEKIALDFVDFPLDQYKDQVQVSDKDLEVYYNEHKEDFREGAKRRYAYAYLPRKAIDRNIGPFSEEETQAYYNDHLESYEEPKGMHLRQIVAKFDEKPDMTEQEREAMTSATLQRSKGSRRSCARTTRTSAIWPTRFPKTPTMRRPAAPANATGVWSAGSPKKIRCATAPHSSRPRWNWKRGN